VEVYAEDQYGNVDPTYSGLITITLASNPGNSSLGGTLTLPAQSGAAYFLNLTLNRLSMGYTLRATSPGLTSIVSAPFNIVG
jgi:hypothetical protein